MTASNTIFSTKKENDTNNNTSKKKINLEKSAEKLLNLWSLPLHTFPQLTETWNTRLVLLNKVFPEIPTRKEMRPIVVQSPS